VSSEARRYDAALRSGWDTYRGAVEAARAGDASRLVDCLRGCKPLSSGDRDRLTAYITAKVRRRRWPDWLAKVLSIESPTDADYGHLANFVELELRGRYQGRPHNEAVHRAARLAEVILSLAPPTLRDRIIDYVCKIEPQAKRERVRDLLDRPEARRHKH
jgi:hypothetical protein